MLICFSYVRLCDPGLQPARLLCLWDSSGKNTGVGCHALLQEILPTQGLNPCLLCLLHYVLFCILVILFYLFMAVLGLCSTPRLSLVEAVGAALPCTVRGFSLRCPLLLQSRALEDVGFSSCGAQAQLPCTVWNLPRPGIELVPPALAGRFLTTGPLEVLVALFDLILFHTSKKKSYPSNWSVLSYVSICEGEVRVDFSLRSQSHHLTQLGEGSQKLPGSPLFGVFAHSQH